MILVFGGQGQLGQELQRQAALAGAVLMFLSRAECDIADPDAVRATLERVRPALVVNCAAYTGVDKAEAEPERAFAVNARGAGVVAAACEATGAPLIHLSTDYVFDGRKSGAYVENDPLAPLGVYGRSKAGGEAEVRLHARRHVILRTAWVYGVFGHNFLKTMLRLAAERTELRIVADQRGCPTGTPGLARAILAIAPRLIRDAEACDETRWGAYHLTGPGETTWHGFASWIVEQQAAVTGKRPAVTAIATADYPTPAERPKNSVLDCSRFRKVFGIELPDWQAESAGIIRELLAKG